MSRDATPESVRVLIVDDHAAVRRGIRTYLEVLGIVVVAEAADGHEALHELEVMAERGELPDVVLLDLVMPNMDGATATARITRRWPQIRVVILTSFGQQERIQAALSNGAARYLLKDAEPTEVVAAIREEAFPDPVLAQRPSRRDRPPH
ncbi:response regulator [Saccharopolyspora sp. 5N708]|uniref:response regulator n=1 Tax=Saccharopolyspora sp. 5N708 TaxID=3457424 RepID=UPI003FCFBA34